MLEIGIRHCYIVDENDPTKIKLISEMTPTNPRFYQLVKPTDAEAKDRLNRLLDLTSDHRAQNRLLLPTDRLQHLVLD